MSSARIRFSNFGLMRQKSIQHRIKKSYSPIGFRNRIGGLLEHLAPAENALLMSCDCVILFRNTRTGEVGFVSDDDGELLVFSNHDDAVSGAETVPILRAFPYQIIELDE